MNKKPMLVKLAALALGLGLVTGCATTEQMKQLQADVAKAQETADAALAAANDAKGIGSGAERQADAAMAKASAAKKAADAAQVTANECKERCSRILEKSMAK